MHPEHGRIVDVNDTWVDTLGISREEAVGKSGQELGLWRDPVKGERCRAMLRARNLVSSLAFTPLIMSSADVLCSLAICSNFPNVAGSLALIHLK